VSFELLAKHAGYSHVRFLARDVPSLGYRCYQVVEMHQNASAQPEQNALPVSNILENAYYRIEVDPQAGAIKGVFDKQLDRDMVDTSSPYRFNQYLYVSGGSGETQFVYMRKSLPFPKLTITSASGGQVTSVRRTPYGQILTLETVLTRPLSRRTSFSTTVRSEST